MWVVSDNALETNVPLIVQQTSFSSVPNDAHVDTRQKEH